MSDLISRQAATKAIHDEFDECLVWDESGEFTANEVERVLDGLPTIEPKMVVEDYCRPRNLMVVAAEDFHRFTEPKRGKWLDFGWPHCSECGYEQRRRTNYCPNCGAKMFAKNIDVPNKEGAKNEAG